MSRLVDKSLVTAPVGDDARFTQLQTLWEYGRDRLEESHEADAVRANHADLLPANGRRGPSTPAR